MIERSDNDIYYRIMALERQIGYLSEVQSQQTEAIQETKEQLEKQTIYGQQNYIRNGDLSFTRNTYLYTTDFNGGTGEDQNVSEEAAFIYTYPKPADVETTGSINAGSNTLTISSGLFVPSDAGKLITVYGADAGGTDLATSISSYISSTQCLLAATASTTVTNTRVRFRLSYFTEDTTDNNVDGNLATNSALKTSAHTRYATTINNPDYDKANGYIRYSDSSNILAFPLPQNVIMPGRSYILSFLYKLANQVNSQDELFCDFFFGIWDNTFGRNQYLEGTPITLTGTVIGGTGTTTRSYTLIMLRADGITIRSETLTLTNTPATLTPSNYVQLSWPQDSSVVGTILYRQTGSTIHQVAFPFPTNTFYDTGGFLQVVASIPAGDTNKDIAMFKVNSATFAPASVKEWRLGSFHITIPKTYDKSKTTGNQWLIIGLNTSLTGTGATRALLMDKISLDDKYGFFTICPLDFNAKRNTSTATTFGDQGGIGILVPPGGGENCISLDDFVETDKGPVKARDLIDNEKNYKIKTKFGEFKNFQVLVTNPQKIMTVFLENGFYFTGSLSHRVIRSEIDIEGVPMNELKLYDEVLTEKGTSKVINIIEHFDKKHTLKIRVESGDPTFWQNGVCVHNIKPIGDF